MYHSSSSVNQLTTLLLAHGLTDIVVCPGSRNAPIVHNLYQVSLEACHQHSLRLHPVTDERSAAFVALGLSLWASRASSGLVAICVTSGSALLACLPAVAEAYYRHLPLVVVSADRPAWHINQAEGQTIRQVDALTPYCRTYQLYTELDDCPLPATLVLQNNRLINEALSSCHLHGGRPCHINVPLEEPLFRFTTPALPVQRVIKISHPQSATPLSPDIISLISAARLPALVIGQYEQDDLKPLVSALHTNHQLLVLSEIISQTPFSQHMNAFDSMSSDCKELLPDVVIQVGGNFIHKRFIKLLSQASTTQVIRIGEEEECIDTFGHATYKVEARASLALQQLQNQLPANPEVQRAASSLHQSSRSQRDTLLASAPPLSLQTVIHHVTHLLAGRHDVSLHLANSSTIRAAANVIDNPDIPIFCNRGVNGIEGSMSSAVGYALCAEGLTVFITGDLSFFYDVNALWNVHLPSNLRILLYNDGGGAIFGRLPGLHMSPAYPSYIAATQCDENHCPSYHAEGICATFGLDYQAVDTPAQLSSALSKWLAPGSRAHLLEICPRATSSSRSQ